ncbi:MAG: PaaI family thioesterase [Beijerinckiaceae bacterium]
MTVQMRDRISESFARQTIMSTLGATLAEVEAGRVVIALAHAPHICQQHGFLHAGVVSTILDSACGYAGLSLMPEGSAVLTAEFKINLLTPAKGQRFLAEGRVVKAGRTLTIAQGEVVAIDGQKRTTVAIMTATLVRLEERDGVKG